MPNRMDETDRPERLPHIDAELQHMILDRVHISSLFTVGTVCRAWWQHMGAKNGVELYARHVLRERTEKVMSLNDSLIPAKVDTDAPTYSRVQSPPTDRLPLFKKTHDELANCLQHIMSRFFCHQKVPQQVFVRPDCANGTMNFGLRDHLPGRSERANFFGLSPEQIYLMEWTITSLRVETKNPEWWPSWDRMDQVVAIRDFVNKALGKNIQFDYWFAETMRL